MNQHLTVNGYPFKEAPLEADLTFFAGAGFPAVGLWEQKVTDTGWEETARLLRRHRVRVEYLVKVSMFTVDDESRWEAERGALVALLDAAAGLGVPAVYGTTGPAGGMLYEDAAAAFARAVAPVAAHAQRVGVALLVELQNPLGQGASFVSTFRDLAALAESAQVGICLDLFHCWREGGLLDTFGRVVDRVGLVQVGDYAPGIRQLGERVVPGDGIVPLDALLGGMARSGYRGLFDLEITGPRIETEGREDAFRRGAANLSAVLDRVL